jgi:hypothetical protein
MATYEIHLVVPKGARLTPAMVQWLQAQRLATGGAPEAHWPVRRLRQKAVARMLLRLDPSLIAVPGPGGDVELRFPDQMLGLALYLHDRGVLIHFPYMAYSITLRIVLGITYSYIRFLYEAAGFWSYDPQLNLISYADDFQSIEETAALMEVLAPRQISGGPTGTA